MVNFILKKYRHAVYFEHLIRADNVNVAFLTLLPRRSFNCGNEAKVALRSSPSKVGRKLFGYLHRYNAGKKENCFA